ncbi:hypothetical protein PFDG_03040 [Plasmodium falciparum Dd2]|uniref:Uncharacterized protein n=1 Tax=Plasmodium falciparum (isolate Dd2) TaxID=57267 RepID=A0A0L7M466_PLAF4|nr:hypothetical protein PFDG_03040 [Plasmodium falciparum Dd2]
MIIFKYQRIIRMIIIILFVTIINIIQCVK